MKSKINEMYAQGLLTAGGIANAIASGWITDADAVSILGEEDGLAAAKTARIAQSKEAHPIQWTDGAYYAITADKQQQLASKIMAATMAQTLSADYRLTWNSTGEVCREWTLPDLSALAFAIDARVTALVTYQQTQEVAMRGAETLDDLRAVTVDYDSVGGIDGAGG